VGPSLEVRGTPKEGEGQLKQVGTNQEKKKIAQEKLCRLEKLQRAQLDLGNLKIRGGGTFECSLRRDSKRLGEEKSRGTRKVRQDGSESLEKRKLEPTSQKD